MYEHRVHQVGILNSQTVARRRRVHAARRRTAGVRARMAELRANAAMHNLAGAEHVRDGNRAT
jgi:hypothetical protein